MAIHRIRKERDYLIIDNAILRDPKLSLKAKGLLAFMLSRPDDWSFSIKGLSKFCRDGPDAVRSAVAELEKRGYLVRTRTRSHGRYQDVVYDIYERPIPVLENPAQEKTEKIYPNVETETIPSIDLPKMDKPITESIYNPSINPDGTMENRIKEQIEYNFLCQEFDCRLLDNLVAVMIEVMMLDRDTIYIGKEREYPTAYVRACMKKIGSLHIQQIMGSLIENQPVIRNVRGYLLTMLINAANTMDMGYEYGE